MLAYDEDFTSVTGGAGPPGRNPADGAAKDFTEHLHEFTGQFPQLAAGVPAKVLVFGAGGVNSPGTSFNNYIVPTHSRSLPPVDDPMDNDDEHDDHDCDKTDYEEMHGGMHEDRHEDRHEGMHEDRHEEHLDETDNNSPYMSFRVGKQSSILDLAVGKQSSILDLAVAR
jgi:hypothetical protein